MKIHLLRQGVYELLALTFRRPTSQQLATVTAEEAVALMRAAIDLLPHPLSAAIRLHLGRFLAQVETKGLSAMAEELSLEYCRLFIGPYALPCPPYGSVYLDGGQVMGPSAVDVLSRYRRAGLRTARGWAEPPDHIALELEFMARLAARFSTATEGRQDGEARHLLGLQREFLRDHLGRWGTAFADRLARAASCHLYHFLAAFLPAWLAFDADILEALDRDPLGVRSSGG